VRQIGASAAVASFSRTDSGLRRSPCAGPSGARAGSSPCRRAAGKPQSLCRSPTANFGNSWGRGAEQLEAEQLEAEQLEAEQLEAEQLEAERAAGGGAAGGEVSAAEHTSGRGAALPTKQQGSLESRLRSKAMLCRTAQQRANMFAEAVLGMEHGGVAVAWSLQTVSVRASLIVAAKTSSQGPAGLKELWAKKARQVPALGGAHHCLSLVQIDRAQNKPLPKNKSKAQADVLLHRLRYYALPGWDAAAERRDAQDDFHSAAQARAWTDGATSMMRATALLPTAWAARLIGARRRRHQPGPEPQTGAQGISTGPVSG
jgi:hypothetical protein